MLTTKDHPTVDVGKKVNIGSQKMIHAQIDFDLNELFHTDDFKSRLEQEIIDTIIGEVKTHVRITMQKDKQLQKLIDKVRQDAYLRLTKVIEQ